MSGKKRRLGDRKEGTKIRTMDAMNIVGVYIMPNRNGASNLFRDNFDVANAELFIKRKREEGLKGFGMMHLIIAAYIRTVSQRPGINRFIGGQKIFKRNNIDIAMTIKKDLTLNSQETCIKVRFEPTDTAEDVFRKMNEAIDKFKNEDEDSSFDGTAKFLSVVPGVVLKFAIWFIKLLDYFDLIPKKLLGLSPFHASMFITSMGSLGIPPIFHHLYDLGNVPVFIAFGAKRSQNEISDDGHVVKKKYIDYCVTCDERICDGHYYASGLKYFKEVLKNPEVLDLPPQTVVEDMD